MKKTLPVILAVLFGLVVVGFLVFKRQSTSPAQISPQGASLEETFVGRLKEAVMKGVPLKCTWQQGDYLSEGYIKGEQYYGKMQTPQGESYVIMKDNCMWAWAKGEAQGVKNCFVPEEGETDFWEMEEAPQNVLNCVPATITDSQFEPPTEVNFVDMQQIMQQFGQ